jgi:predicted dehydrogenase
MNIGIIGYRGFAYFCAEALRDSPLANIVALCGRNEAGLRAAARDLGIDRVYTDYRELVADPEVQLVHISTPPADHPAMATAAIEAGKHIMVEKPLAVDRAGGEAVMSALSNHPGIIGGINYVMRYSPLYEKVKQIADRRLLGDLTHVSFQNYASDEGLGNEHWFWDLEQSGGIFVEHGVHFFDIIGRIIESPASEVQARTWLRQGQHPHEDRVSATVTHENGVTATYYHAFNRPGILERQIAHFTFERGHVTVYGWTPTRLDLDAIVDADCCNALESLFPSLSVVENIDAVRGGGNVHEVAFRVQSTEDLGNPTPLYTAAVRVAFEDVIRGASTASVPRVSVADGLQSLRVALAARDAAKSGAVVRL